MFRDFQLFSVFNPLGMSKREERHSQTEKKINTFMIFNRSSWVCQTLVTVLLVLLFGRQVRREKSQRRRGPSETVPFVNNGFVYIFVIRSHPEIRKTENVRHCRFPCPAQLLTARFRKTGRRRRGRKTIDRPHWHVGVCTAPPDDDADNARISQSSSRGSGRRGVYSYHSCPTASVRILLVVPDRVCRT